MKELTIFYDGGCPLCAKEMRHLQNLDTEQRIAYEDINAPDFNRRFPYIDRLKADQILHGELAGGELIYALDVTYVAWSMVGKRHWVAPLRWPLIKQVANWGYKIFAKHRHRLSTLLTGQARCDTCHSKGQVK